MQLLLKNIFNENGKEQTEGLDIIHYKIQKKDSPNIGFTNNKFYCHSFEIIDDSGNSVNEYIKDNIRAYQYHPENSKIN